MTVLFWIWIGVLSAWTVLWALGWYADSKEPTDALGGLPSMIATGLGVLLLAVSLLLRWLL